VRLEIQKSKITGVVNLLDKLSLKGKKSRHRSKLKNKLVKSWEEVMEQEKQLIKEYANLDEHGEPIIIDGKEYDVPDENISELGKARKELFEEYIVIDEGDFENTVKIVKTVLDETNIEFSGAEADLYDYTCEQMENAEIGKEKA
jgi:Protein of unknown function (DUF1617)